MICLVEEPAIPDWSMVSGCRQIRRQPLFSERLLRSGRSLYRNAEDCDSQSEELLMSRIVDTCPPEEQAEAPPVTLADHAEFLISPRRILCRDTVRLPGVCLHTGRAEHLVERSRTFLSMTVPMGMLTAIVVTGVIVLLHRLAGVVSFALVPVMIAGFVLMLPRLHARGLPGLVAVQADWYVNADYARRCWWRTWVIRLSLVLIPTLLIMAGYHRILAQYMDINSTLIATIMMVTGVLMGVLLRIERRLKYAGKVRRGPHAGLYAVTGHSTTFTDAVERLIRGGY